METAEERKLFSLPSSKPSAARRHKSSPTAGCGGESGDEAGEEAAKPQFITVFDPSQGSASSSPTPVIPPIPNSYQFLRPPADAVETRSVSSFGDDLASHLSYGLTLRSSNPITGAAAGEAESPPVEESRDVRRHGPTEDDVIRRFREDMRNLPEHRGFDEYKDVPVAYFGAALLAGYGWSKGKGIGRNSKGDTKVVLYKHWGGTYGLGYKPSTSDPKKTKGREWVFGQHKEKDKEEEAVVQKSGGSGAERRESLQWLTKHIRVRIISQEFMGGKLYLEKGRVVDVVSPTTCDVAMDGSGELLQGVDQEILDTVLPKTGGSVLVLYGEHKGVSGSLVERNTEGTGLVKDADSHALINVRLEQIAEYTGVPSYLGD